MSGAAHGERVALRAALAALDAARVAVEAALGDGAETVDLEDHERWLTIKEAAFVARCSERTIRRGLSQTGAKRGGRWYVDKHKIMPVRSR